MTTRSPVMGSSDQSPDPALAIKSSGIPSANIESPQDLDLLAPSVDKLDEQAVSTNDSASANTIPPSGSSHLPVGKEEIISDNDNEKPVREQLKKTTIAPSSKDTTPDIIPTEGEIYSLQTSARIQTNHPSAQHALNHNKSQHPTASESNGESNATRMPRKRSYDELEDCDDELSRPDGSSSYISGQSPNPPARKRSRDLNSQTSSMSPESQSGLGEEIRSENAEKSTEDEDLTDITTDEQDNILPPEPSAEAEAKEDAAKNSILSPKKKRSREQFDKDLRETLSQEQVQTESPSKDNNNQPVRNSSRTVRDEPEKKRHRDTLKDASENEQTMADKVPGQIRDTSRKDKRRHSHRASQPENTPAYITLGSPGTPPETSPIQIDVSPPPPNPTSTHKTYDNNLPQTSSEAFAASGFGALAKSSTSAFGTLGANSGSGKSPFGALASQKPIDGSRSGFASLASGKKIGDFSSGFSGTSTERPSEFALGASGFGKIGSGFGTGFASSKGPFSSFGSKGGQGIIGLSEKPAKPFGAPANGQDSPDESEEDDNDKGDESAVKKKEVKEDRRFQKQEVSTGEELELTAFSCRAKLYYFTGKAWKERGLGTFKVNISGGDTEISQPSKDNTNTQDEKVEERPSQGDKAAEDDRFSGSVVETEAKVTKKSARMLMRADGAFRVILNAPIYHGMIIGGDGEGTKPTGKAVTFLAPLDEGKPTPIRLMTSSNAIAKELWKLVTDLQAEI
ncbi:MAG: hypothetical protein M1829_002067 [Trizodia sp. TS-e1964]|nr:MAG: hypothetical protein M1829_002067 [Trizodia sp. TS-e1964]